MGDVSHDRRMFELSKRPRFPLEAREVTRLALPDEFDRDQVPRGSITGAVHLAHSTAVGEALDLEASADHAAGR
jgi:hypothetical protein